MQRWRDVRVNFITLMTCISMTFTSDITISQQVVGGTTVYYQCCYQQQKNYFMIAIDFFYYYYYDYQAIILSTSFITIIVVILLIWIVLKWHNLYYVELNFLTIFNHSRAIIKIYDQFKLKSILLKDNTPQKYAKWSISPKVLVAVAT